MNGHLEPLVCTLRIYEDGKSYDNLDPFVFTATIIKHGDTCMVVGGHGEYSMSIHKKVVSTVKEMFNIKTIEWDRVDKQAGKGVRKKVIIKV